MLINQSDVEKSEFVKAYKSIKKYLKENPLFIVTFIICFIIIVFTISARNSAESDKAKRENILKINNSMKKFRHGPYDELDKLL